MPTEFRHTTLMCAPQGRRAKRYIVSVTLLSPRGSSGLRPFTSASVAANNCAGMIYGIGVKTSAGRGPEKPSLAGITRAVGVAASLLD